MRLEERVPSHQLHQDATDAPHVAGVRPSQPKNHLRSHRHASFGGKYAQASVRQDTSQDMGAYLWRAIMPG
eukprot:scaffold65997_cov26-Prasinocladus_malaysianus.AAC.1